jgi:flagellar protein FlaG
VSPTELKRAIDSANNALGQSNAGVEFSIDKNTDQTVVKVVESGTGDVIRQYPSKEAIAIAQAITDLQQQMAQRQSSSQSAGSELKGLLIKQQG